MTFFSCIEQLMYLQHLVTLYVCPYHTWPSRSQNYRCRFRIWCFWPCMMVSVPFWYRWLWFSKYRSRIGPGDFDFPQCRSRLVSLIDDCISNQSLAPSRRKIIISCLVCDWTTAKTSQRTYWSVLLLEPLQLSADSPDGRPAWLREVRLGWLPDQLAATHHTAIHFIQLIWQSTLNGFPP